jgi:hypothetical protein
MLIQKVRIGWLYYTTLSLTMLLYSVAARADWVNLTGAENAANIAEIFIEDDHVRVNLEIYPKDVIHMEDLLPDELLGERKIDRPPLRKRLRHFSEKKLQIVTDKGVKLRAQLKLIEPRQRKDRFTPFRNMINPLTGRNSNKPPEDKRVIYAELVYPFKGKPKTLTFVPPFNQQGYVAATIGFIAYHKAVPIIDFRYLPNRETLNLVWEDPWYTVFENPSLKRHHKSALMSYLYIEPYEVRHEVLVRVKDLKHWIDLGLRSDRYIEVDELNHLKKRVGEFLLTRNMVTIDGKRLHPILDRTNYIKLSLGGIQILEQPERLDTSTAIVGVIITFITEKIPQRVSIHWDMFNEKLQQIPTNCIDPAGPFPSLVTPENPVIEWVNYLHTYKPPTVSRVAVASSYDKFSIPLGSIIWPLSSTLIRASTLQHEAPTSVTSQQASVLSCFTIFPASW